MVRRADMVGHTGDMKATTHACALVDSCVKELLATVDDVGGRWLVRPVQNLLRLFNLRLPGFQSPSAEELSATVGVVGGLQLVRP